MNIEEIKKSFELGIEAKRQIRRSLDKKRKWAWMAERVRYPIAGHTTIVMRTFKAEVFDDGYLYTLINNGTPWYRRGMQILSHYGLHSGSVLKGRGLICKDRNNAMAACWKDSERPILDPMDCDSDPIEHIIERLESYAILETGVY